MSREQPPCRYSRLAADARHLARTVASDDMRTLYEHMAERYERLVDQSRPDTPLPDIRAA